MISTKIQQAHRYAGEPSDAPVLDCNAIGMLFAQRAAAQPQAIFIRYIDDDSGETTSYTYAQFADAVARAAGFLTAQK